MHINNISQKAASFILHKRFHPGNFKNMEKVWLAEQRMADAARRDTELSQKRAQEMKIKELRQRNTESSTSNDLIHSSIQWVYAHDEPKPSTISSPPKMPLEGAEPMPATTSAKPRHETNKYVLEEPSRFGQVSDADLLRKLREDPLMEIKKAEVLRSRRAVTKHEFVVKRPRWDRQAPSDNDYIIPNRDESSPSGTNPLPAVKARSPAGRVDPSSDEEDEDLGPSVEMRNSIRNRHAEVALMDRRHAEQSASSVRSENSSEQPDALQAMIQRGREHEDERRLRVERVRLLERAVEFEELPKHEMPAFKTRLQAATLENYDRGKALRSRKHDATLFEDRKYHEADEVRSAPKSNVT